MLTVGYAPTFFPFFTYNVKVFRKPPRDEFISYLTKLSIATSKALRRINRGWGL